MTLIPDRLPEPLALANAAPKRPGKNGDTAFVRAMDRQRQATLEPATGSASAAVAEVFNARGFFQPPVPDLASAEADMPGTTSVGDRDATAHARRPRDAGSAIDMIVRPAAGSGVPADDLVPVRVNIPVLTPPAKTYAGASDGHPNAPTIGSTKNTTRHKAGSERAAPVSGARPAASAPGANANMQIAVRNAADGLGVSARIDGLDHHRRSKLRAAIAGLLARHGFLPGQVRINGETETSPRQERC